MYTAYMQTESILFFVHQGILKAVHSSYTAIKCKYVCRYCILGYRMMTSYIKGKGVHVNGLPALPVTRKHP